MSRAQAVIAADQRVDRNYRAVQKQLKAEIISNPERIDTWLRLVNTARNLERIADHAAKIAESVIYLKQGEILRHRTADPAGRLKSRFVSPRGERPELILIAPERLNSGGDQRPDGMKTVERHHNEVPAQDSQVNRTTVAEGKTGRLIEPCGWHVAAVDSEFEPGDVRLS